jgi:O-acetyl-ADP-ribose deacetylase (regulator of RNase III)
MTNEKKINGKTVRLLRGDITLLDAQAFVYYAQHDLKLGAGWGNAIMARGGPSVQKELDELGRKAETCEVVATSAGELKAKYILHAVGPRFQEPDVEGKLRTTVGNVLRLAEDKGIASIAFPAMGCGFYGVPLALAAETTLELVKEHLKGDSTVTSVTICVNDTTELPPFQAKLATLS